GCGEPITAASAWLGVAPSMPKRRLLAHKPDYLQDEGRHGPRSGKSVVDAQKSDGRTQCETYRGRGLEECPGQNRVHSSKDEDRWHQNEPRDGLGKEERTDARQVPVAREPQMQMNGSRSADHPGPKQQGTEDKEAKWHR
ncbi:MAG TPA: hypothetical protein VII19_08530, partial [Acidimicrobiales bacterium]